METPVKITRAIIVILSYSKIIETDGMKQKFQPGELFQNVLKKDHKYDFIKDLNSVSSFQPTINKNSRKMASSKSCKGEVFDRLAITPKNKKEQEKESSKSVYTTKSGNSNPLNNNPF
jgi:hypothetical protein